VTLLCGASVFLASLQRLLATAPGFSAEGVLSMQMMLPPSRYADAPARATFVRQMLERVSALPGVVAAGTTQTTFLPNQSMQTSFFVEGRPVDGEHTETAHIRHITPGYFRALNVPTVEGRAVDDRDQMGQPAVCMVSARFAKQFWPNESALGHRVRRVGATAQWLTIVGVAADVMDAGLGVQQGPTLYVPYLQQNTPTARVSLLVRTAGDPIAIAKAVQQAIWAIDPLEPVDRVERLRDVLVDSTGDQQFRTVLLSAFALVGLALALVGIYGVTAAAVKARTWETGVRMALGASPVRVVLDMIAEAGRRVLAGTIGGVVLFVALNRLAGSLLDNTSTLEVRVLVLAVAPLVAAAMLVSFLQARQLASVSPVSALRER
jgi:putative ABC transport system permease protein